MRCGLAKTAQVVRADSEVSMLPIRPQIDDASSYHLSFQVIGSRLKPGCAEGKIVGSAIELMHRSGE
jgi:hypothetical protein